jgi:hypothetical protein
MSIAAVRYGVQGWNPWLGAQPPTSFGFQCPNQCGYSGNTAVSAVELLAIDQLSPFPHGKGWNREGDRRSIPLR